MSDFSLRLPARPSLEQLRKQAKDLLRDFRAGDAVALKCVYTAIPRLMNAAPANEFTLTDAQFVLARQYGFEHWAALAQHVTLITMAGNRFARYEKLAANLVTAYAGDAQALAQINELFPHNLSFTQLQESVQQYLADSPDITDKAPDFSINGARQIIARQHGFDSWANFAESFAQVPADLPATPIGFSATPPFYKVDWNNNEIEPGPLMASQDWDVILDVMKECQITGLNANGQMTDAVLERLARLDFVTKLNLDGSVRVTDEGLAHLVRMPQLRELNLSGWHSQITDRGLEVLRHLTELRRFQMCWPQRVTDTGAAYLRFCDQLEHIDVMGTPTGDGVLAALAGKSRLRHLKAGSQVTAEGLSFLHQLPQFKVWQGGKPSYALMGFEAEPTYLLLPPTHFTERGLERLAGLDGLFALNIDGPVQVTAKGISPLAELPNLGWLGVDPTDEAMRHIAALPKLHMLMCQDTKATDAGFIALGRSKTLEYIWGRKCYGLTGSGFAALSEIPSLKGLSVSCLNVDDAALAALPHFPALRELMPMDVSDDGFRHVGRCEQLENLWCMYCRDTGDAATEHIAGLSKLKTYYAGKTKITDRSLEILSSMNSLETLEFWECAAITNAGLAQLASLPRLREITVGGSPHIARSALTVFPNNVRANFW